MDRQPRPAGAGLPVVAVWVVLAKAALLVLLGLVLVDPTWGNLEGKAPFARAVVYPMLAFVVPVWWQLRRERTPYPWTADLLVTLGCFSDVLGNRLDLYDSVVWFDDVVHLVTGGLVTGAFLLLSVPDRRPAATLLRALGLAVSLAIAWELFEYLSFVAQSRELSGAYADTLGDLALFWLGSFVVAVLVADRGLGATAPPADPAADRTADGSALGELRREAAGGDRPPALGHDPEQ